MFERTLSLCRRLIGKGDPATADATVVEDERRLWVRYAADRETAVNLAHGEEPRRLAVRVRDISVGGVNLITDHPFHPGQILGLELPSNDEPEVALACVIHAGSVGQGKWSLGCAFSRELAPADLARFGAPSDYPRPDEQRGEIRHPCALSATYQCVGAHDEATCTARVLNVSATGVGLSLTEPVDAGSLINLRLQNADGSLVRTILACVVHSGRGTGGEQVIGCNFIRELADDELQSLL
jgi:hypothetical protein